MKTQRLICFFIMTCLLLTALSACGFEITTTAFTSTTVHTTSATSIISSSVNTTQTNAPTTMTTAPTTSGTTAPTTSRTTAPLGPTILTSHLTFKNQQALSVGQFHMVALRKDGTVVAFIPGINYGTGLGLYKDAFDLSTWTDVVSVAAGKGMGYAPTLWTFGLKKDGTVQFTSSQRNRWGKQPPAWDWTDIVAISAGYSHVVGLKSDGTVRAFGYNDDLGCDVSGWKDIAAVSAGDAYTVGLKKDGTVVAVGDNSERQCEVTSWKNIVTVSAGFGQTIGLKKDGTVVAVGANDHNQCDVSSWNNIIAVTTGYGFSAGLTKDGTVLLTDDTSVGPLFSPITRSFITGWKDIIAISASNGNIAGLKKDGTVVLHGLKGDFSVVADFVNWKDIGLPLIK